MEFFQTTSDARSPHHIRLVEPLDFDVITPKGSTKGSSSIVNNNDQLIATSPSTLPRSKKSILFNRLGQVVGEVQGSQCSPTAPSVPTPNGINSSRFFVNDSKDDHATKAWLKTLYQSDRADLEYDNFPKLMLDEVGGPREFGPSLSPPGIQLSSNIVEPRSPDNVDLFNDPVLLSIREEIRVIIAERDRIRKEGEERIKKSLEVKRQKQREMEDKKNKEKEAEEKEKEKKRKVEEEKTKQEVATAAPAKVAMTPTTKEKADGKGKGNVISDPVMEKLYPLLKRGKGLLVEYEKIKVDPNYKAFRAESMRLATTTMNLCSFNVQSVNEAAKNLIGRLRQLGNDSGDPQYQFTISHLASQFFEQARSQIQKNPKSCWSFGVLLHLIRQELPEMYSSIIGIILLDAPTAIPIFHLSAIGENDWIGKPSPKRSDLTEREVKRIFAICQLYWCSLVQGNDTEEVWRLWSRILQCDLPIGLVAASCLVEITGQYMIDSYPLQGRKLVHYLREKSMKSWGNLVSKKNSTAQEKHYFTRLENLLEKSAQLGSFPEPPGRNMIAQTTKGT